MGQYDGAEMLQAPLRGGQEKINCPDVAADAMS